ncbi:MAG: sugar kinase [Betaproteobacteria bacterium]|nr:sugar kinase [Betaproteobacteria bacterium]
MPPLPRWRDRPRRWAQRAVDVNLPLTTPPVTGRAPRAIAVGAVCVTRIFQVEQVPALPAKVMARRMAEVVDGMALSAACAFARLGGHAAIWARIGDDEPGRVARATLAAEGLDVSGLRAVPGAASSQASVIIDGRGERLVVPFHDPSVDASAQWLPLQALAHSDMLLCDVRWPEGAEAALRAARAAGVPAMLDGEVAAPGVLERLVPLASHAVFSDAGLLAYSGAGSVERALREVAVALAGSAVHVGATCGAEGYAWFDQGVIRRVPAPAVPVVDTLAAGDVFHGSFALALVQGADIAQAARRACHAASLKCTRFGGRLGCPTRGELDAFMASRDRPA